MPEHTTPPFSFSEKVLLDATLIVALVYAFGPDNQRYYAYIAARPQRLETLYRLQQQGKPYTLQDYGTILTAGLDEPDAATRIWMEEHYGFLH